MRTIHEGTSLVIPAQAGISPRSLNAAARPLCTPPGIKVRSTAGLRLTISRQHVAAGNVRLTAPRAGAWVKLARNRNYGGCGAIMCPAQRPARLPAIRLRPLLFKVGTGCNTLAAQPAA